MSSIPIEDHVRAALEVAAASRGLSLSNYLAMVATSDAHSEILRAGAERSLADLIAPILAEATAKRPEPRTASGGSMDSGFDAAMTEKYLKQGFSL